ncbi:MAG: alpha/beta hydrolase [Ginsengibacter sp.]
MKHIYCISGFAADERVFAHLNFGENSIHFIPWKIPQYEESIESYAHRMCEDILHPNPVLLGLSFGGMMSIEIAKEIPVAKIILISSVSTLRELPLYMKIAGKLRLNHLVPLRPYSFLEPWENYTLGAHTPEEKQLVREYRQHLNLQYSDWAIEQVLNWKNKWFPKNVVHIHGTKDHIFPIKNIKADFVIKGGGHLMLMNKAGEINEILKKVL